MQLISTAKKVPAQNCAISKKATEWKNYLENINDGLAIIFPIYDGIIENNCLIFKLTLFWDTKIWRNNERLAGKEFATLREPKIWTWRKPYNNHRHTECYSPSREAKTDMYTKYSSSNRKDLVYIYNNLGIESSTQNITRYWSGAGIAGRI